MVRLRIVPALWALLASTGMRRSDVLGLPWRDVDFDSARLTVRQSLVSVDGTPELGPPKSRHAVRTIDLDERTVAALRAQRRSQNEQRLATGPEWAGTGLVFTHPDGRWLHPDWVTELFRRLVDEVGLPAIRMHDYADFGVMPTSAQPRPSPLACHAAAALEP